MYQVTLIQLDSLIEEKVVVKINEIEITGFASIFPYPIVAGKSYPINLSLTILDDPEIIQLNKPRYGFERIDKTFKYFLYGKLCGDSIDIGNNIKIQGDIFKENLYLNEHFIKMKTDRFSIEFLDVFTNKLA